MGCYHPIPAYQRTPGKKPQLGKIGRELKNLALPCGTCIGCRSAHALQWATRCEHEAKLNKWNAFITLTYDDEHLPPEGHLNVAHLQKFLKRIRKSISTHPHHYTRDPTRNLRYFACGEYGEHNGRPHYHILAFNLGFADRYKCGGSNEKGLLFASPLLTTVWGQGDARYGQATAAAANYIAQYSLKKQGSGEYDQDGVWRPKPFLVMSRKPRIGAKWLETYYNDLRKGYIVRDGKPQAIPRAYLKHLEKLNPQLYEEIKQTKYQARADNPTDADEPARLAAAEQIHKRYKELTESRSL